MTATLDHIIDHIEDFPTLPSVYTSMLELMANPRTTVNQIADAIASDPACSLKLLKTVNSGLYGLRGRVSTIHEAVFQVGFNEVKNIVTAISVIQMFPKNFGVQSFTLIDLWKHSIAVGVIARLLAKKLKVRNSESYYTQGLLHDLGKMFFMRAMSDEYAHIVRMVSEQQRSILETEREVLGTDHTRVGESIARKWQLPDSMCHTLRWHEEGLINGVYNTDVAVIHLADIAARILELGYGGDRIVPQPQIEIWEHLSLAPGTFESMLPEIMHDYEHSTAIMLM